MNWYIFGIFYLINFLIAPFIWKWFIAWMDDEDYFSIHPFDWFYSFIWPFTILFILLASFIVLMENLYDKIDKKSFKTPFKKDKNESI